MMKVAVISRGIPTPTYPLNGIFEWDQAKALAQKGLQVAFVVIDFRSGSFKRKYGLLRYQREGIQVFELSLPINVYRKALPLLRQLLRIPFRAMLKSFGKPDVLHAHFYSIAAIASTLGRRYGIPFLITEHSSKLNRPAEQISALDKKLAATAYASCDLLISVSETLRQNLLRNFKQDSIVIHNMVDNHDFQFSDQAKNESPFVYVSVGNLTPLKAFDQLIDAFSQVKDDARLLIIGEGPERTRLEAQIRQLGLQEQVCLLGQQPHPEINRIFQQSHVFALASRSETFGLSYIEALYAGLPVIATRCGGPESFVNDENGLLTPVDDIPALAQAMKTIRKDYHRFNRQQLSASCLQQFAPDKIADQLIEAYRSTRV